MVALMAVSLWLSLDEPPSAALYAVFIALLVVIQLRQDAINAFFAHRRQVPGCEVSRTVFYPDCYVVTFLGAEAKWQYDKILLPLETRDYFILLLGKANAHALPKAGLEGAAPEQFRAFLAEKTGKPSSGSGGGTSDEPWEKSRLPGGASPLPGRPGLVQANLPHALEGVHPRALYMALLDDEICRNELEGNIIGGEEIRFPPKAESLHYRYRSTCP